MSGTVNYPKVIDQLTDVIKELNVGFAPCGAAAPSEETRRADAVGLLKALLSTLEHGSASGGAGAAAAAAENAAASDKYPWGNMETAQRLEFLRAQEGSFSVPKGGRNNVKDL
jgi:hypothetical protein